MTPLRNDDNDVSLIVIAIQSLFDVVNKLAVFDDLWLCRYYIVVLLNGCGINQSINQSLFVSGKKPIWSKPKRVVKSKKIYIHADTKSNHKHSQQNTSATHRNNSNVSEINYQHIARRPPVCTLYMTEIVHNSVKTGEFQIEHFANSFHILQCLRLTIKLCKVLNNLTVHTTVLYLVFYSCYCNL